METFGRLLVVASLTALAAGCGRADVAADTAATQPTPSGSSVQPTPTPTAPAGFFVNGIFGSDSNDGSLAAPFATIQYAIRAASGAAIQDVWIEKGSYPEIVELADGVNLHGAVCPATSAPVKIDFDACPTLVEGGSPTMVARGIHQSTVVENLLIYGAPAVQTSESLDGNFFQIDGLGCVGRGITSTFSACNRSALADGKPSALPAISLAIVDSSAIHFLHDDIRSDKGGDGLPGDDAPAATMTTVSQPRGGNAWGTTDADRPYLSGDGAVAVAAPECAEGRGGNGGMGGRFYWDGHSGRNILGQKLFLGFLVKTSGYAGEDGMPSYVHQSATVGLGQAWEWNQNKGANGTDGGNGQRGVDGVAGTPGVHDLDAALLTAGDGQDGDRGFSGEGGAGGGGGGPATRLHFASGSDSHSVGAHILKYLGVSHSHTTTYTNETQQGENAAGGGGAGGAGGCGGFGGKGGHGGASSIAIYLMNASIDLTGSHVLAGPGGMGGAGGAGSAGKGGLPGSAGGLGSSTPNVDITTSKNDNNGFDVTTGEWGLGGTYSISSGKSEGYGASQAGAGGRGGNGGNGGNGGVGGGGAGGSSIGVLVQGVGAAGSGLATVETSAPGTGGGTGDAKGADGVQMASYELGSTMQ